MKNFDVTVSLSTAPIVGNVGSNIPLIYVVGLAIPYTECMGATAVKNACSGATSTLKTKIETAVDLMFMQNNPPSKVAVFGTTADCLEDTGLKTIEYKDWYQLLVIGATSTNAQIATYIETLKTKMFFADVTDTDITAQSGGDAPWTGFDYSVGCYSKTIDSAECGLKAAALIGATAGKDVGSFTYKNIVIKGLTPYDADETTVASLHASGVITLLEKAGKTVTSEGIVCSGEYIDVVDSKCWIQRRIEYGVQTLMINTDKIPYDNRGISMIESVVYGALLDAYNHGMIAEDDDGAPMFTTSFPARAATTAADRAARKYTYGGFNASLAGAIHYATISGVIEV